MYPTSQQQKTSYRCNVNLKVSSPNSVFLQSNTFVALWNLEFSRIIFNLNFTGKSVIKHIWIPYKYPRTSVLRSHIFQFSDLTSVQNSPLITKYKAQQEFSFIKLLKLSQIYTLNVSMQCNDVNEPPFAPILSKFEFSWSNLQSNNYWAVLSLKTQLLTLFLTQHWISQFC